MNIISDTDMALDSGDAWQCEHCGRVHWVEVGIGVQCPCGIASKKAQEQAEAFDKAYTGSKRKVKRVITIEVETYDTPMAFDDALQDFAMYYEDGSREDDILGFKWRIL